MATFHRYGGLVPTISSNPSGPPAANFRAWVPLQSTLVRERFSAPPAGAGRLTAAAAEGAAGPDPGMAIHPLGTARSPHFLLSSEGATLELGQEPGADDGE